MKGIVVLGVLIALAGLISFAYPVFTTNRTEELAKIGSVKVQTQEQVHHSIPPLLSGGLLVLGAILIGAGAFARR